MSQDSWTCLMVTDGPGMLPGSVCATLKMSACELSLKKWEQMPIVSDVCSGTIVTQWKTHSIGGRSGILFRTQIDSIAGDYKVNFLLSAADLDRGAEVLREYEEGEQGLWMRKEGILPCPDLYRFYDLHNTARRLVH